MFIWIIRNLFSDHIDCMDEIKTELDGDKEYDLFVTCDVSARDRLALAGPYFDTAKKPPALIITSVIRDLHRSITSEAK